MFYCSHNQLVISELRNNRADAHFAENHSIFTMKINLIKSRRQKWLGCSVFKMILCGVLLILAQMAIVLHQVVLWSWLRCEDPIRCSKGSYENHIVTRRAERSDANTLQDNNVETVDCGIKGQGERGSANLHIWYGWCGYTTDDLRRDPSFPERPNVKTTVKDFKVDLKESRHFSGKRLFGYIHPPKTGVYQFFISSCDSSDLWLSTNDDPRNTRMIAYLGEASNQYGACARPGEYSKTKSQQSLNISLIAGMSYYIEMYQKTKELLDHMQVAWRIPGSTERQVIGSEYLSQYMKDSKLNAKTWKKHRREDCIMQSVLGLTLRYNKFMLFQIPSVLDDYFYKADLLEHSKVSDVLRACSYKPKYLPKSLRQFESQSTVRHTLIFPEDNTHMPKDNRKHDISIGNVVIPTKEANRVVSSYMNALRAKKGDEFVLNRVIQVEGKYDIDGGARYLIELDLKQRGKEKPVRLSEYVFSPSRKPAKLCYPEGYQWRNDSTIYLVVTVKNYGYWMKDLVKQFSKFYREKVDRNFHLIVIDFNSTDINLKQVLENSDLKNRYTILQKFETFYKSKGLNEGVALIKDPHSIVFTLDLHLTFPANIFDAIRKHTIEGKTAFVPKLTKLKCGYTPRFAQGWWDVFGYGLYGVYKSDWDRIGGMDEVSFRQKWGGEDVDLADRTLVAQIDLERICLPKFYHMFHSRDSGDWYKDARV